MKSLNASRLLIALGALPAAHAVAAAQGPVTQNSLIYSNGKLSGFRKLVLQRKANIVHVTGPGTIVEAREKGGASTVRIHADDIEIERAKDGSIKDLRMRGGVRYAMAERLPSGGERIVEGTSESGEYHQAEHVLSLVGSVRATAADPTLASPAGLQCTRLDVDISQAPYSFTLTGAPDSTEIHLAPKQAAAGRKTTHTDIRAAGFRSATLRMGRRATFHGPAVRIALQGPDSAGSLQAGNIDARLQADDSTVVSASLDGDVHTVFRRTVEGGKTEVLDAAGASGAYEAAGDIVTLDGGVRASITLPGSLSGPATIHASRLTAGIAAGRYELLGSADGALLAFSVAPPKADPAHPTPSGLFSGGMTRISSFTRGAFISGKSLDFDGPGLQMEMTDPSTHALAQMRSPHVRATLTEQNLLEQADATGGVDFLLQQPTADAKAMQSARGRADNAAVTVSGADRQVQLRGPLRVAVTDPDHLPKPGRIVGQSGDTLTLRSAADQRTFDIDVDSPREVATLEFEPPAARKGPAVRKAPVAGSARPAVKRRRK